MTPHQKVYLGLSEALISFYMGRLIASKDDTNARDWRALWRIEIYRFTNQRLPFIGTKATLRGVETRMRKQDPGYRLAAEHVLTEQLRLIPADKLTRQDTTMFW